jgi:hypothetical protein
MRNIFLLFFVFFTTIVFGQNPCLEDTTQLTLPVWVGKEILLDLNELERLKSIELQTTKEISELEKKIIYQEKSISVLEETNNKNLRVIGLTEEKVNLLNEENNQLMSDIGKLKTKNTVIEIIGGAIIGALTYIIVFK